MKTVRCLCLIFALVSLSFLEVRADDVNAVIAKARAVVGDEAALTTLTSVHNVGTLETTVLNEKGESKEVKVAIEIIFQKPYQQRIVATSDEKIEITALDDYEGWQREQDPKDSARWRMTLLGKDQIKRLRANTWENLAFYRDIARSGGRVEDLGVVTVDGKSCRKLSFVHDDGIIFTRYFDQDSGRLILTETENGVKIREQEEILSSGLKFPRKIFTESKLSDGKIRSVSITFDKVLVNETFADSLFGVPPMGR